jgi:hypothetical protein
LFSQFFGVVFVILWSYFSVPVSKFPNNFKRLKLSSKVLNSRDKRYPNSLQKCDVGSEVPKLHRGKISKLILEVLKFHKGEMCELI